MPGWKALSDELDPDVRAFVERLRRMVDRSGLGVTAVAERTGHDRSAWDAYLSARRPVPRNAVAALAEVTGSDPGDLAEGWERAERAWARNAGPADLAGPAGPADSAGADGPGDDRTMQIRRVEGAPSASAPRSASASTSPSAPASPPSSPRPDSPAPRRRALLLYGAGILGALLVVTAALLLVDLGGTGGTGGTDDRATAPPSPTAPTAAPSTSLPAGVKCAGPGCTGRDPEAMGCGGTLATTVARTRVGTARVEVRHSATCAAAWARITGAVSGDAVTVEVAGVTRRAVVPAGADTDAYTPMVAVGSGAEARACGALADGSEGCTTE
ncbi:XRE family transcriptional regulator [Streptomyces sp. NBC_00090]|uniref:helix-turn-helix domain-containing protein n=1 Tax=Streptomyces sp. NBC_00090 TaxID=2903619 RepID=UPI0032446F56